MGEVSSGANLIKSDVISQRNYKDNAYEVASPTYPKLKETQALYWYAYRIDQNQDPESRVVSGLELHFCISSVDVPRSD